MSNLLIPQSLCRRVASVPIVVGRIQSRAAHSKSKRFAPIKRKNESARQPAPRADPAPSLASAAAPSVPIVNPIAGPSSYAGENQANLPTRQLSACLWSFTIAKPSNRCDRGVCFKCERQQSFIPIPMYVICQLSRMWVYEIVRSYRWRSYMVRLL